MSDRFFSILARGAASDAARELGVVAGRNWLLSLLTSLLRLGKAAEVSSMAR